MVSRLTLRLIGSSLRYYGTAAPVHQQNPKTITSPTEKWNISVAVCLLRKPVITKLLSKEEKAAADVLLQEEGERSLKSTWELKAEEEKEAMNEGKAVLKTRGDWEMEWTSELESMKLGPRVTEADRSKDVKSLNRLLDSTLMLVVRQENHGNRWILPQGDIRGPTEPLRQTAERVLHQHCGKMVEVQFYGNAPCGYFKYKYPAAVRGEKMFVGDKVFFYKAYYKGGELSFSENVKDFKWIGRNEVKQELESPYRNALETFLLDEAFVYV